MIHSNTSLTPATSLAGVNPLALAALQANQYASAITLAEYQEAKDEDTLKSLKDSIVAFKDFLADVGVEGAADLDLAGDLSTWASVSHGLVTAYKHWLMREGRAMGTIRVRLSAVRTYCELAARAGYLPPAELTLIKTVKGYRGKEARNVDARRATTRVGEKRATEDMPLLDDSQVSALKDQPKWRDALLMCLLLDHGLRCGEVAGLSTDGLKVTRQEVDVAGQGSVEIFSGFLTFYREKVHKTQTHRLTPATARAAWHYLGSVKLKGVKLFNGRLSTEDGDGDKGYSTRGINQRVVTLGHRLGVEISPHVLRHNWATRVARSRPNMRQFQEAGGWNSPAMPMWYAQSAAIANDGIKPVDLVEVELVTT